jgi:hypothetical protein
VSGPRHSHDELTRWARFVRSHLPMLAVFLVVVASVALVAGDWWRRGALVLGIAVLVGSGLRLALPESRVGLLAVRSRAFDVTAMLLMGVAIVYIAASIDSLGTR